MAASSFSLSRRRLLAVSALGLLAGCSTTAVMTPGTPMPGTEDETALALPAVNKLRQSKGLPPLALDKPAQQAAAWQASRMAKVEEMKHVIGFGDSFGDRMIKGGVSLPAAENIASGQMTVDAVVQAWINSPHHLENMLGRYRGLGVARAQGADKRPYWSMVLSG